MKKFFDFLYWVLVGVACALMVLFAIWPVLIFLAFND